MVLNLNDEQRDRVAGTINYSSLPEHLAEGMMKYVEAGIKPGSFLMNCLMNNFVRSVLSADACSLDSILQIARFIYDELPSESWGSENKVERWSKLGGLYKMGGR